ncbi:MAG: phage major capsid protein [Dehalococcoidia bacterium]
MALLLAQAAKLSSDIMLKGVIAETIKDSHVLQYLPFIEIVGNGLAYNRVNAPPTADWYDVGDTWAEDAPTFDQATAVLKILGGDADVDNFIRSTRMNEQDIEAAVISLKARALAWEFEEKFIYGDNTTYPKQWDGIRKLIDLTTPGSQVVVKGAAGVTLTLAHIDELIDTVQGGKPDLLLMSKRTRRKIKALARAAGTNLTVGSGQLGQQVDLYDDIPIGISDWILDTHTVSASKETSTTGAACSVVYALRFGENSVCGLSGPGLMQVERVGQLETKDATRTRLKWYCSMAAFSAVELAALIGVKD